MRSRRLAPSAVVIGLLAASCGGSETGPRAAPARPVVVSAPRAIHALGDRLQARIATGARDVVSIAGAGGRIWVSSYDQRALIEVDPRRDEVSHRMPLPGRPAQMLPYDGLLWVLLPDDGLLAGVDPRTRRIVRFVRSERTCLTGLAVGDRALWLTDDNVAWTASKRDPRSGVTLESLPPVGPYRCAMALAAGALWAGSAGRVHRIDLRTNRVTARIDAGPEPLSTAYAVGDEVWFGNDDEGEMRRIDAKAGRVTGVFRFGGGSLVADGPILWATSSRHTGLPGGTDPDLFQLDRRTDRVIGRFRIGRRARKTARPFPNCPSRVHGACMHEQDATIRGFALSGLAVAFGSVWVGQNVEGRVYRIATGS